MKKITFFTFLILLTASIFAQTWEAAPLYEKSNSSNLKSTNSLPWTLQFGVNIGTQFWGPGTAGIESDGTNIFVGKWASNKFYRLTAAGALVDSFAVTGTPAFPSGTSVRDLAYDGQFFYGGCNNNIIYKMNFTTHTIVGSTTLPTGILVRHISYDPNADGGLGGFWAGGWSDNIVLYSRTGTVLNSIPASGLGTFSAYGSAYDSVSPGGPYLWLYSQTGTSTNELIQVKIATKLKTGLVYNVANDISGLPAGSLAGGCFLRTNLIAGTTTLGGLVQGSAVWGYNLASTIPPAYGVSVVSLGLPNYALINSPLTLAGSLNNFGATTITSFKLNYSVNGAAAVSQNVTGVNIATYANYNYSHSASWTPPVTQGTYSVKLWVSNINGNTTLFSDTINKVVTTLSTIPTKRVVVEEATGAWCQYCPDGAVKLLQLLTANPNAIGVALHNDDGMVTPESDAVNSAYISGFPSGLVDMYKFSSEGTVELNRTLWAAKTTERLAMVSPVSVSGNNTYNSSTREVVVNVSATFYAGLTGEFRFNSFIVEDSVSGTGSAYNQVNYYNTTVGHPMYQLGNPIIGYQHRHVLRKMMGGAWGAAGSIPATIVANTPYSYTFNYTLPAGFKENDIEVVILVQKYNSSLNDREILNANKMELNGGITGIVDVISDKDLSVYPNPASDAVSIKYSLNAENKVKINIYNVLGKLVCSVDKGKVDAGNYTSYIDISSLSKGFYIVKLEIGNNVITKKISVN